jgi:MarR family transcriptional regulator, organic hydroperoxide resistance regulator
VTTGTGKRAEDGRRQHESRPQPASGHLRLVQDVVGLWVEMQGRLQAHFAALAAEHALSAIQAKVLIQLEPSGAVTMRALSERVQYDPSNLTSVIDRLESLGAVERQPDPRDRRVKRLLLTEQGLRLRDQFWRRLVSEAGPLGRLSAEDLTQLHQILRTALASR